MVVNQECVVNFLVSTRHTYIAQNALAIVQVMNGSEDRYISVRYHYLIPKSHELILLNLKYKKTEDNRLNIYIDSNDPVVSILSASDFSRLELKNELITELPQDAIDAVEVWFGYFGREYNFPAIITIIWQYYFQQVFPSTLQN